MLQKKDEMSSYLHDDSLVGVYKGDLKNLSDKKNKGFAREFKTW